MEFVHLHNHSDYSLLDGAASIEGYVEKATEFGMKHLALTDHGNMFGALRFYEACKKANINPLVGCEVYISPSSRFVRDANTKYFHMILIAKNTQGYQNLLELVSIAWKEGYYFRPRIDDEVLQKYHEGLICTAACIAGEIPRLIISGQYEKAKERALFYKKIFGEDFYIEIQRHGIPEEHIANNGLIQLAHETGIELIATNDIHYLNKEDWEAHDILLCIGTGKKLKDENRFRFSTKEFYFKSPQEMQELFKDIPEAIENTLKVAQKCNLTIPEPGPILPDYAIPEGYQTAEEYVRFLVSEGLKERYHPVTEEIKQRAEEELSVIFNMDGKSFAGYFLIVWDFINWARNHNIPVGPGRGSGAGSIVAYAMKITDIDPLKYNLLFERFLNTERVSMPDFDVDFSDEGREDVIQYVREKYGEEKVGSICTFGTLKAKAALKDVARVLDIPFDTANEISALMPEGKVEITVQEEKEGKIIEKTKSVDYTIPLALKHTPELMNYYNKDDLFKKLFDVATTLENLHRHVSTHACGIVIGKEKLTHYVPLFKDPKTQQISTEYTMDLIEPRGLVKMDFLGLKTLTIIKNTEKMIQKTNPNFNTDTISVEDPKTFKLMSEGKSEAVFQFESAGMQKILREAKPNSIEDLIALNALYRPGPMQFIDQFIESKNGKSKVEYPDPSLEKVLAPTYGVIVYQEQVMQVGQIIGGFSLGKADEMRRAMGKKKVKIMESMGKEFVDGAVARGYDATHAKNIYEMLKPFAGYGFNKSHAAAYSILAFKTAYLKAHYPAEFMAANLTNEMNDPKKFPAYLDLCKKMNLSILPPNINLSEKNFTVVDGKIYYGLQGIKKVGEIVVDHILAEREKNGHFLNLLDFLDRVDIRIVNKGVCEAFILSGLFDEMGYNRATLIFNLESLLNYYSKKKENSKNGQGSLFEDNEKEIFPDPEITEQEEFSKSEQLRQEKEFLGFFYSGHPMDEVKELWEKAINIDLSNLQNCTPGKKYVALGIVKDLRTFVIQKMGKNHNRTMATCTIEDFKGSIKATFFPDCWEQFNTLVTNEKIVALKGKIDFGKNNEGQPQLIIEQVKEPQDLQVAQSKEIHIRFSPVFKEQDLFEVKNFLYSYPGKCMVYFHLPSQEKNNPQEPFSADENKKYQKEAIFRASSNALISDNPTLLKELEKASCITAVWSE